MILSKDIYKDMDVWEEVLILLNLEVIFFYRGIGNTLSDNVFSGIWTAFLIINSTSLIVILNKISVI